MEQREEKAPEETAGPADAASCADATGCADAARCADATGPTDAASAAPGAGAGSVGRLGSGAFAAASAAAEWVARARVRLSLTGVVLLVFGALLTNSVWTLPLVIAGALMVAVAWIGRRLEGRLAIEWGPGGTQLAFRATIRPGGGPDPRQVMPAGALVRAEPDVTVIEGQAHTVEIDVAELEALIAAAEAGGADGVQVTRQSPAHDARQPPVHEARQSPVHEVRQSPVHEVRQPPVHEVRQPPVHEVR